jgi:hypothetical protein
MISVVHILLKLVFPKGRLDLSKSQHFSNAPPLRLFNRPGFLPSQAIQNIGELREVVIELDKEALLVSVGLHRSEDYLANNPESQQDDRLYGRGELVNVRS